MAQPEFRDRLIQSGLIPAMVMEADFGRKILADAALPNVHVSPTMLEAAKKAWHDATN